MFKNLSKKRQWMKPYLITLIICSITIFGCILCTLIMGGASLFMPVALIVSIIIMIIEGLLLVGIVNEISDKHKKKP